MFASVEDNEEATVFQLLERIGMEAATHEHEDGHDDQRDREANPESHAGPASEYGLDPHVWLDPILVRDRIVPALVEAISRLDPDGDEEYRGRGEEFRRALGQLDRDIRSRLITTGGRYVAFHNAWRHFARRYELREIAVVQEFAGEEPTPRELGQLVRAARNAALPAILVEPQLDPRLARTLSDEFAGTTVMVDPLGDPEGAERSTYLGLMRFNASAFFRAMRKIDALEPAHPSGRPAPTSKSGHEQGGIR